MESYTLRPFVSGFFHLAYRFQVHPRCRLRQYEFIAFCREVHVKPQSLQMPRDLAVSPLPWPLAAPTHSPGWRRTPPVLLLCPDASTPGHAQDMTRGYSLAFPPFPDPA